MQVILTKEQPESFWRFLFKKRQDKKIESLIIDFDKQCITHRNGSIKSLSFRRIDDIRLEGAVISLQVTSDLAVEPITISFGDVASPASALAELKTAWRKPLTTNEVKPPRKQYNIQTERRIHALANYYNIAPEHVPYAGIMQ